MCEVDLVGFDLHCTVGKTMLTARVSMLYPISFSKQRATTGIYTPHTNSNTYITQFTPHTQIYMQIVTYIKQFMATVGTARSRLKSWG